MCSIRFYQTACSSFFISLLLCLSSGELFGNQPVILPDSNFSPLEFKVIKVVEEDVDPYEKWRVSGRFFTLDMPAVNAWRKGHSSKRGVSLRSIYYEDAEVEMSLFPTKLLFPDGKTNGLEGAYLEGLGLVEVAATSVDPVEAFGESLDLGILGIPPVIQMIVDYELLEADSFEPFICRDYLIAVYSEKNITYTLRIHLRRTESVPKGVFAELLDAFADLGIDYTYSRE